jgi:glucose-1-phosphate cytidylyltransferase
MKTYGHYGFRRFVLCLGYKSSEIKNYFLEYRELVADFTLTLSDDHTPTFHNSAGDEDWEVTFAETGLLTGTGARLRRVRDYLTGPRFMLTYGDGIGTIDIATLLETHVRAGRVGTVTGVRPTSRYGELATTGDAVSQFAEKPPQTGWSAAGTSSSSGSSSTSTSTTIRVFCSSGTRCSNSPETASSPSTRTRGSGWGWTRSATGPS